MPRRYKGGGHVYALLKGFTKRDNFTNKELLQYLESQGRAYKATRNLSVLLYVWRLAGKVKHLGRGRYALVEQQQQHVCPTCGHVKET